MTNYKLYLVQNPSTEKNSSHLPLASNFELFVTTRVSWLPLHCCLESNNQADCVSLRGSPEKCSSKQVAVFVYGVVSSLSANPQL